MFFFLWLLIRQRVLTQTNLQRRGFALASQCLLCKESVEDIEHLFCRCPVTSQVWDYFRPSQDASSRGTVGEILLNWCPQNSSLHGTLIRSFIPHALVWLLWKERNARCFDEEGITVQQLISRIKECVWGWHLGVDSASKVSIESIMFNWHSM